MKMKKIIYLLFFVSFLFTLRAQDTIHPFSTDYPQFIDTGFMQHYLLPDRPIDYDSFYRTRPHHCTPTWTDPDSGINVYRFVVPPHVQQVLVTGVTIPIRPSIKNQSVYRGVLLTFDSNDYLHNDYLHPNIRMTSSTLSYQDTQGFDCYIRVPDSSSCGKGYGGYIGTHTLYFDQPILVTDTFFVGFYVSRIQSYDAWRDLVHTIISISCANLYNRPMTLFACQHSYYNCCLDEHGEVGGYTWFTTQSFTGVCPILFVPERDTFGCPEVEGFGFAGMNAGSPTFVWDTASEHEVHQVAYGPYDAPLESLRIVETNASFLEIFDNSLSPDIYYQARLRARCHHRCPIHDTVMWTAWSAPVYFYTGDHMPDTTHQPEGIDAPGEALPFAIVPNPSRTGTRQVVEIGRQVPLQGLTLTLHDAAGHEVLRMEVKEHRFALPVQGLPAGVYVATLASPQGTAVRRVVVES